MVIMSKQKSEQATSQVCISIYPDQKEWVRKHHINLSGLFRNFLDDYIKDYEDFLKKRKENK